MVVTGKSIMETQRKHPQMVLIRTSIQGEWLVLDAPDMPSLRLPLRGPDVPEDNLSESWDATSLPPHIINTKQVLIPLYSGNKIKPAIVFSIFGTDVSGVDCGEEASEWLSSFMDQKNTRLIYHPVSFGGREVAIGEIDSSVKFWKEGDKVTRQSFSSFSIGSFFSSIFYFYSIMLFANITDYFCRRWTLLVDEQRIHG